MGTFTTFVNSTFTLGTYLLNSAAESPFICALQVHGRAPAVLFVYTETKISLQ